MKNKVKNIIIFFFIIFFFISASFYSFSDAVKKVAGKDRDAIISFLNFFKRIVLVKEYDSKAKEFHEYLDKSISKFQFSDLYHSKYMKEGNLGEKYLVYFAEYKAQNYKISLLDKEYETIEVSRQGDFVARLALKKNSVSSVTEGTFSKSESYSGNLKIKTVFGKVSHETGAKLLEELLAVIDPQNIDKMDLTHSEFYKDCKKPEERKVIGILSQDFPRFLKYIHYYTKANKALETKESFGKKYTKLYIQGFVNRKTLLKDFPYLMSYLEDIIDIGWIHITLSNLENKNLLDIHLNSKTLELNLVTFTHQGKVIPFTLDGRQEILDFSKSIELSKLTNYPFQAKISFYANIYGLKFTNPEILFNASYTKKTNQGLIEFKLQKISPTKVNGQFIVVPAWLIDMFIPGNMEEIVNHFFQVLVQANQGKGSFISFIWEKESEIWFFKTQAEAEFLDNFFVRFGLRVWNHIIWPDEDARNDLSKVVSRVIEILVDEFPK